MKSFKEYTMPLGHYRPIAKIGNKKSPEPRPTYAVNANAKGPDPSVHESQLYLQKRLRSLRKKIKKEYLET